MLPRNSKIIQRIKNFSPYLFFLVVFIFIWKINYLTPLWADDYCRLGSSTTFIEALKIAYDRYFTWTGRFFVMFINYLVFGNYPASIGLFNFVNALFFCLIIYLIFVLANGRNPKRGRDIISLLLIFNLLFVGTKGIGEVVFWKTGSIGYLWGVAFELIVLLPFFTHIRGSLQPLLSKYWVLLFYLISFLAATFIEHFSIAVSFIVVWISFGGVINKKNVPVFLKNLAVLHVLGTFILVGASGNFARSLTENITPLFDRVITNFNLVVGGLAGIFIFFWLVASVNKTFIATFKNSILWFLFALAGITLIVFSLAPAEQAFIFRIAFPLEVAMIIAITHLFSFFPKIVIFELVFGSILFINAWANSVSAYNNSGYVRDQLVERDQLISDQRKDNKDLVVLTPISILDYQGVEREIVWKYKYKSDLSDDPGYWANTCFAKALGLKQAIVR